MKKVQILHNPHAGRQEHSKEKLISLAKSNGFDWGYSSIKKIGWKKLHPKTDFIVVAGGDGTVRQVAVKLIHKKKKRIPILLLPLGTANNIAKSLGIDGHVENIVANINKKHVMKFDVGKVDGLKKEMIFVESFGYGIFPELMKRMEEKPENENASTEENLKVALKTLREIVLNYPAKPFTISMDGMEHTENYIMAEVMNINSLGPNLNLSSSSDPGDGIFELVLVGEKQREELANYVSYKLSGIEKNFVPLTLRGQEIRISTEAGYVHIDDELVKLKKPKKVKVKPEPGKLEFFVQ